MIALVYLIISFISGYAICSYAFPQLRTIGRYSYQKKPIQLNSYYVLLPAYSLIGLVTQTWCVYLLAYLFREKDEPLILANAVTMILFAVFSCILCYILKNNKSDGQIEIQKVQVTTIEKVFFIAVGILTYTLMWKTFFVRGDSLHVGYTVYSDFSPHLGMIRSFSYGNNFPTAYSHFAGEDIKYHFMFQFLVGNLEFLGMRIDNAFNIPSAIGFLSTVSLLYVFAYKLTARKSVGLLSCLFFIFRSSNSVFKFIAEQPRGNVIKALLDNNEFISYSTNESWGLWNLNVYSNQRHFAFSIAILLLILMQFMPHLFEMSDRMRRLFKVRKDKDSLINRSWFSDKITEVKFFISNSLFHKEGWKIKDLRLAVAGGVLLGSITFWNGASTIAALLVLFAIAIVADRRLEFLILAVITGILSLLQSHLFIKGSAVVPKLLFGFIAEDKTLFGTMDYIARLLGVLVIVLGLAVIVVKGIEKYIMMAFSFPFLFAFSVSLTQDVTVNHKYIMISVMLLSIFAAVIIDKLFALKKVWYLVTCIVLVFFLTATGIYDYTMVLKKNRSTMIYDRNDPLTMWVKENSDSKDIFLSPNYALNNVVLGGAMLFEGWQYFAWSAGYDTASRDVLTKQMYEASDGDELNKLVIENNIRYIIVDNEVRNSPSYTVNEAVISNTYQAVFTYEENGSNTVIYDTIK